MASGRFAPSPTGRMHLGNVFTALMSWLSARASGGKWILRIEDLDPQRSRLDYARIIEDDLCWLGLDWDEGGLDGRGPNGPYLQSLRHDFYREALSRLMESGMTYPCTCRRADIMASQAPHQSDGRVIYRGTCRPDCLPAPYDYSAHDAGRKAAVRIAIPEEDILFDDLVFGPQSVNLARECGDFILRRADGAWAYQLAVVVDDAAMGVEEVVRGCDLLLSAAQQTFLFRQLGLEPPRYAHLPLICNRDGVRLSKRDQSMSMEELRKRHTAEDVIGLLASLAGIIPEPFPCTAASLIPLFSWSKFHPAQERIIMP